MRQRQQGTIMPALDYRAPHIEPTEAEAFMNLPDDAPLDAMAQELIGAHLRALFESVVQEPIPERFLLLLQTLEAQDSDLA